MHQQDLTRVAIEGLRPHLPFFGNGLDEAHLNAHVVTVPDRSGLDQIVNSQLGRDIGNRHVRARVLHDRPPGDHAQPADSTELSDQGLVRTGNEGFLLGIAGQVFDRQHGHRDEVRGACLGRAARDPPSSGHYDEGRCRDRQHASAGSPRLQLLGLLGGGQGSIQILRRGIPVRGLRRHGLRDHSFHVRRYLLPALSEVRRHVRRLQRQDHVRRRTVERRFARQHLPQDAAQCIQICPAVHLTAGRLLGTHVLRRAHSQSRRRRIPTTGGSQRTRHPEVGDHGVSGLEHNVRRLDVSVYHSLPVRIAQGVRHFPGYSESLVHRQLALANYPLLQGLPIDERHHVIQETARPARIDQGEDPRVGQAGDGFDLA